MHAIEYKGYIFFPEVLTELEEAGLPFSKIIEIIDYGIEVYIFKSNEFNYKAKNYITQKEFVITREPMIVVENYPRQSGTTTKLLKEVYETLKEEDYSKGQTFVICGWNNARTDKIKKFKDTYTDYNDCSREMRVGLDNALKELFVVSVDECIERIKGSNKTHFNIFVDDCFNLGETQQDILLGFLKCLKSNQTFTLKAVGAKVSSAVERFENYL